MAKKTLKEKVEYLEKQAKDNYKQLSEADKEKNRKAAKRLFDKSQSGEVNEPIELLK